MIKQRAQFPVDQFKTLRDAFPCVIAGIRELGEFVPLKTGVFDLLIIDEGSQVSVAQAMPAMLRAKQVVIFGDRRQFSNVKSHQASNVTNSGYMSALQDHFRQNVTNPPQWTRLIVYSGLTLNGRFWSLSHWWPTTSRCYGSILRLSRTYQSNT